MIVVDASVAIRVALYEPESPIALASLRRDGWSAPDLIMAELSNIVWKRFRAGEITRDQADEAVQLIETMNLHTEPGRRLIRRATALAIALEHAAYDCFYLALAEDLQCPFLTLDRKLITKVRQSTATGVEMIDLKDYAAEFDL